MEPRNTVRFDPLCFFGNGRFIFAKPSGRALMCIPTSHIGSDEGFDAIRRDYAPRLGPSPYPGFFFRV